MKTFWSNLGALLTPSRRGSCIFAIDGLANTLHLYRQNVKFKTVVRNAKTFINVGGAAVWKFIVFAHNEHQVDDARRESEKLGFSRFQVVKTKRFFKKTTGKVKPYTPVRDPQTNNLVRRLYPPRNPKYQNMAVVRDGRDILKRHGSMRAYYDKSCIRCKAVQSREIYISCEGHVFPCCWIGTHLRGRMDASDRQFLHMIDRHGGLDAIDAKRKSIHDILRSDLYQKALPDSWLQRSVRDGKLQTCARICGSELHTFEHEKRENMRVNPKRRSVWRMPATIATAIFFLVLWLYYY